MLCQVCFENSLQIQFLMMLIVYYSTLSHRFSCQNYLPLYCSHLLLLQFIWYFFLQCHIYTESPGICVEIEAASSSSFPSDSKPMQGFCCGQNGSAPTLSHAPSLSRNSLFPSLYTLRALLPQALNSALFVKNTFLCINSQLNPLFLSGHHSDPTLKGLWLLTP